MPESLGARLRRRREDQQIALSTIAERTKIKASLLEALERDDVSNWPAGIYRRAFIRSYAAAIGLDPDPIVREFLDLYPDPEESPVEASPSSGGFRGVVGQALGSLARLGRGASPEPPPASRTGPLDRHDVSLPASIIDADRDVLPAPDVEPPTGAAPLPAETAGSAAGTPESPRADPTAPAPVRSGARAEPPAGGAFDLDLLAVARVCTGFARIETGDDVPPLLADAARVLGALGMIAWIWDPIVEGLRPVLAHGYPDRLLAQLPTVGRDDDNATAAAYRTGEPCAIRGDGASNGALVVPLMTAAGAAGVLAIELPHGREEDDGVRAAATIVASMVSPLVCSARATEPDPISEPRSDEMPLSPPVLRTTHGRH